MALTVAACSGGYQPGLGELMSLTQMRHAKLWFAGQEQNWPLAEYEVDELQEGFDLVPKIMGQPLAGVRAAVKARDPRTFAAAYDALTAGCNSCHQATNFGFNVVKRPSSPSWFGNQTFAVGQQ